MSPRNCLALAFLILPTLLFSSYFLASFPYAPDSQVSVHQSLASLPRSSRSWSVYGEDYYPGGAYVSLPYGRVRYWLLGPEKGKKIVLIHGLSLPSIIWKDVAPKLASRGFRVLLYDLYGRGYTDAPQTTYDTALYTTQLALLMQHLGWDSANIVGVSMGGGIAAAFAAQFPQLVSDKVALIASAGLIESSDISRTVKLMSSPLVQSLAASLPIRMYLQRLANSSTPSATPDPLSEIVRLQSAHLAGYNNAVASSLRDGPVRGLSSAFKTLGESGRQVLLIHGTADTTVPYKYAARTSMLIPDATLLTFDGAGHDLAVSHAIEVSAALVRFFSGR
jgi:pimeloyl-ACP methyl ester carboxylesterase